jgi:hypothetical protein
MMDALIVVQVLGFVIVGIAGLAVIFAVHKYLRSAYATVFPAYGRR